MGKWATYQRRGTPTRDAHNCPSVSAVTSLTAVESGAECIVDYDNPVDVPSDWFVLCYRSTDPAGPWDLFESDPVSASPFEAISPSVAGTYFKVLAAANADGSGCTGTETIIHAT